MAAPMNEMKMLPQKLNDESSDESNDDIAETANATPAHKRACQSASDQANNQPLNHISGLEDGAHIDSNNFKLDMVKHREISLLCQQTCYL